MSLSEPTGTTTQGVSESRRGTAVSAPKPRTLNENETLSSFNTWKSNVEFYLSQEANFVQFISGSHKVWTRDSGGSHTRDLPTDSSSTAENKVFYLNQMLGLINQWVPHYLHHEIKVQSTSLDYVWHTIRKYFGFKQSEVQFMKLLDIRWEESERPEHLYQRVIHHLTDNLLQAGGRLKHYGEQVKEAEILSPTVERLAVLRWLELLHPKLPKLVQLKYAFDLQKYSLRDLQEQISDNVDSLLEELRTSEELQVSRVNFQKQKSWPNDKFRTKTWKSGWKGPRSSSQDHKSQCPLCTANNRPATHRLARCRFLSDGDRKGLLQSFMVQVCDESSDEEDPEEEHSK